ncbi:hypothetical protein TWF106_006731 [Orbilia oligospora]|uniref:N-acetyltransferase domain-containing protein n=1 Tax=Orbilia oligospora TaxID=2813651 RepID=A0A6G1MF78_ORBOL|nr:hypothetical protein TWF788_001940 [Orbilia oligospora]KAF3198402.1 hypothetical protein TWF679_002071 [Orbilia oligospora]KAF3205630.1 hypothetical protein TWF191_001795 [Orbilia oligospora]KAF3220405.1 hypothetical protein TWF106_006731 [Orbilia oligospora]KAF3256521.1 hypothetical protein TWF192_001945 [Orbilia oligospora]
MSPTNNFKFRPATLAAGDDRWFVEAWDSTLPYLASIGSTSQWQYIPSNLPGAVSKVKKMVEDSDLSSRKYPISSPEVLSEHGVPPLDWDKAYVAEIDIKREDIPIALADRYSNEQGEIVTIPVGAMVLQGRSPEYVRSVIPEQDEKDPFIFLAFLMTDHRAGKLAKGSGSALLNIAKEEVKRLGLERLCGDCWRGNGRRLVGYYDGQGLKAIGDFDVPKNEQDSWEGAVTEWRA